MRVISRSTLRDFWQMHPETAQPLGQWLRAMREVNWRSMNDLVGTYRRARPLNAERAVFEICGGNYRLIVAFNFTAQIAFVKFIGTHAEYDRIDALTVSRY